jgi:hypothetical protein
MIQNNLVGPFGLVRHHENRDALRSQKIAQLKSGTETIVCEAIVTLHFFHKLMHCIFFELVEKRAFIDKFAYIHLNCPEISTLRLPCRHNYLIA